MNFSQCSPSDKLVFAIIILFLSNNNEYYQLLFRNQVGTKNTNKAKDFSLPVDTLFERDDEKNFKHAF